MRMTLIDYLGRCWRGEESLAVMVWFWGLFIGSLMMALCVYMLTGGVDSYSNFTTALSYVGAHSPASSLPPDPLQGLYALIAAFGLVAWLTYFCWHFVSVWRSAGKTGCPAARWAARLFYMAIFVAIAVYMSWLSQFPLNVPN